MTAVGSKVRCGFVATVIVVLSVGATAADATRCLMVSARPHARSGTQCERVDGITLVRNEGTYRWPGVSFRLAGGETWDLSDVGVIGSRFQYTDQALTGRPDGENYQIGFVSVCDVPYEELVLACRETAAQMYRRRCK